MFYGGAIITFRGVGTHDLTNLKKGSFPYLTKIMRHEHTGSYHL